MEDSQEEEVQKQRQQLKLCSDLRRRLSALSLELSTRTECYRERGVKGKEALEGEALEGGRTSWGVEWNRVDGPVTGHVPPAVSSRAGNLARLRHYFRSWLSDGCYDDAPLEASPKGLFGIRRRLFDTNTSTISGSKVAVTATSISDASAFVFSDYRGSENRHKACGKS